jgi:tetratricopeptide (TPR) repeat protein
MVNLVDYRFFRLAVAVVALTGIAVPYAQEPSAGLRAADADYREGVRALNRGDLAAARRLFAEVVRLAPAAEQGHSALGAVLVRQGQVPEGIRELQKALTIKPTDQSAEENLALAYLETGLAAKALPYFAKLDAGARAGNRQLAPTLLEAWARAEAASGETGPALGHLQAAVAQQPDNPVWRDELGSLYGTRQEWPEAEREFSAAIRIKPEYAVAHFHLGSVLEAERKDGAREELAEAARLAPNDAMMALAVGRTLAGAADDAGALPLLEKAHRLSPDSLAADYELGIVKQRAGQLEKAVALLQPVVAAQPGNSDALINLGMAYTQMQQAKSAIPLLQHAIAMKPGNAMAHQDLAAAYIQLNQVEDAVTELKAALKLSPDSPQLHYNLGLAYKMEDDAQSAIPELETAARQDENAYEPRYVLGLLYMQVARYAEAAAQLERSLKLHPDNGEGWATLGSVYNKMDRPADAVTALREAVKQLPNQSDPHLTLAAVLAKQNEPAEAAAERKIAAGLMRDHMNEQRAEVATNSGKSMLAAGKLEDAITEFRNAVGFDPGYAQAHEGLADALDRLGKSAEAQAERDQAQALRRKAN